MENLSWTNFFRYKPLLWSTYWPFSLRKIYKKSLQHIQSYGADFSIWCAQSHMHMPAHAPLLFIFVWDIEMKKIERTKTSNWMVDHFSLTFVKLSLAWMLYFPVWLQNKRKILSLERILFISMAYIKRFHLFLLDLRQKNLNNPDAYSEPGRTSKIKCFAKIVNS